MKSWSSLYHLESRWRNSHVLVYQFIIRPLQIATFLRVAPFIFTTNSVSCKVFKNGRTLPDLFSKWTPPGVFCWTGSNGVSIGSNSPTNSPCSWPSSNPCSAAHPATSNVIKGCFFNLHIDSNGVNQISWLVCFEKMELNRNLPSTSWSLIKLRYTVTWYIHLVILSHPVRLSNYPTNSLSLYMSNLRCDFPCHWKAVPALLVLRLFGTFWRTWRAWFWQEMKGMKRSV